MPMDRQGMSPLTSIRYKAWGHHAVEWENFFLSLRESILNTVQTTEIQGFSFDCFHSRAYDCWNLFRTIELLDMKTWV